VQIRPISIDPETFFFPLPRRCIFVSCLLFVFGVFLLLWSLVFFPGLMDSVVGGEYDSLLFFLFFESPVPPDKVEILDQFFFMLSVCVSRMRKTRSVAFSFCC